jgi:hypothetical protein
MQSDWAYERLADLTDLVGPRLSGSAGAAAAVEQVAAAMRKLGATVTLQPVKVPHWVRGVETAELVDYTGRPAGITQKVVLTALGGSGATPAAGLTAPVLIVRSFEELKAKAQVKGSIVLFDVAVRPGDGRSWPRRPGLRPWRGLPLRRSEAGGRHGRGGSAGALGRRRELTASHTPAPPAWWRARAFPPPPSPPKTRC